MKTDQSLPRSAQVAGDDALPAYTQAVLKAQLLAAGASGTVYALVMPEGEAALAAVVDGCDRRAMLHDPQALDAARRDRWFALYRAPWTQRQDAMHESYFERWLDWAAPVVSIDAAAFAFRYPTAGASEGIYKLMAEHGAQARSAGNEPSVHIFEGEYEGFAAFAAALAMPLVRHGRDDWAQVPAQLPPHGQFWISQPSAIDGTVWPHFEAFASAMAANAPGVALFPDLTYVGSVARPYRIVLDTPNVPAVVISHSKPFGGYYLRVGGVLARTESASLFGNRWFKNLQSLAWGVEMMDRHDVFALPRRYRPIQETVCAQIAARLGVVGLQPADVTLLATAPVPTEPSPLIQSVLRGGGRDRCVRLCLTPAMAAAIEAD
jgi:hypothetical protein